LLLSGIGPRGDIEKLGINCNLHLPGVGKNLQDHLQLKVTHYCKKSETLRNEALKIGKNYRNWKKNPGCSQSYYLTFASGKLPL